MVAVCMLLGAQAPARAAGAGDGKPPAAVADGARAARASAKSADDRSAPEAGPKSSVGDADAPAAEADAESAAHADAEADAEAEAARRAEALGALPPPPWTILGVRALRTPPVDAFAPCLPPGVSDEAREIALETHRDPAAALEAAGTLRAAEGATRADRLVASVLEARAARDRAAMHASLAAIAAWPAAAREPELRACLALEQARLELWLDRLPEAAAHALAAGRLRGRTEHPARIGEAADFVRAEAYLLAGRTEEAGVLRDALAHSEEPALAAAVRLREADAAFDAGRARSARRDYEALLPHAADFGASISGWGLRAAEAAIADGDVDAAQEWLERWLEESQDDPREPLVRLRVADLLAVEGETATARDTLIRVRATHRDEPAARLAALRVFALGIERKPPEARLARLEAAADDPDAGIARHARVLLAHEWLARGAPDRALEVLARLAFDAGAAALAPSLATDLDSALRAMAEQAVDPASCARLVEVVGWRRRFLARRAGDPHPFVRLGRCYEKLGFPTQAVEVYRHVATHFGREGTRLVALPLARAALRAGDLAVARAAALSRAEEAGPEQAGWRLLVAEIDLAESHADAAAGRAVELVSAGLPADDPVAAVAVLARAVAAGGGDAAARASLVSALGRLARDDARAADPRLGEAALLAAELERGRGALPMARRLYAWAVRALPEGTRRAEAAYWLGALSEDPEAAREALETAAGSGQGGAWGRLARSRLDLARVRERMGAPPLEARR